MLERLTELKDLCVQLKLNDKFLSDDDWVMISHLIAALEPAKIATKKLQYEQLTMGDFYALWLQSILSLKKIENNDFAKILLNTISNPGNVKYYRTNLYCVLFS